MGLIAFMKSRPGVSPRISFVSSSDVLKAPALTHASDHRIADVPSLVAPLFPGRTAPLLEENKINSFGPPIAKSVAAPFVLPTAVPELINPIDVPLFLKAMLLPFVAAVPLKTHASLVLL